MLDDLLVVLQPVEQYYIWDIMAYVIFAFALVGLMASGDDNASVAIFFAIILAGAALDKTYALGWILEPETATLDARIDSHQSIFWVMMIRAAMFIASMMGVVQTKKKFPRVLFVFLVIITLAYVLGRWWSSDGQAFINSRSHLYFLLF